MKAKEYYAKYGELLINPETRDKALADLLMDFFNETNETMKQRKAYTNKAVLAVIDEFNTKWNALCEMSPTPVLVRNGYQAFWYPRLGITKEEADKIRRTKMWR